MDQASLLEQAAVLEAELLGVSERISKINTDTMSEWLIEAIHGDPNLTKYLHLPTDAVLKEALLAVITSSSPLASPFVNLLAQRIAVFLSTVDDVLRHPLRGRGLDSLATNLQHLRTLLGVYQHKYELRKTLSQVAVALTGNRLHVFKSSLKEPDLRVVLKAFYEDRSRDDARAIDSILEFVLGQLLYEVRRPGHIAQPRQAWWGLFTLLKEGREAWLHRHSEKLNKIVRHLVEQVEYSPRLDFDAISIVADLYTRENEDTWVAINAIRTFVSPASRLLSTASVGRLTKKIESSLEGLLQRPPEAINLKMLQSRLILIYESLAYYGLMLSHRIATKRSLDLSGAKIGVYYYDDSVVQAYAAVKETSRTLIADRSKVFKATQSSLLISGEAGQGKSELAKQIGKEVAALAVECGRAGEEKSYSIGFDIVEEKQLHDCLRQIQELETSDPSVVRIVIFDEIDKAGFNFYAPFLSLLERPTSGALTFWIFAQSFRPTYESLRSHAHGLTERSLNDFLTRILLGHVDVPDIRVSPMQRVCTAIGVAKSKHPELCGLEREFVLRAGMASDVRNNRDLIRIVASDGIVKNGVLTLDRRRRGAKTSYVPGGRRGSANIELVL